MEKQENTDGVKPVDSVDLHKEEIEVLQFNISNMEEERYNFLLSFSHDLLTLFFYEER